MVLSKTTTRHCWVRTIRYANLCAGDIHGRIENFSRKLEGFALSLGQDFDLVLQVGDFGIQRNLKERNTGDVGNDNNADEFSEWLAAGRSMPFATYFINGECDDVSFLNNLEDPSEVLPNLFFLHSGTVTKLSANGDEISVAALGGCYPGRESQVTKTDFEITTAYYTNEQINALRHQTDVDLLLVHDPPAMLYPPPHPVIKVHDENDGELLLEVIHEIRPKICFTGHRHFLQANLSGGIHCISLGMIGFSGFLYALELTSEKAGQAQLQGFCWDD